MARRAVGRRARARRSPRAAAATTARRAPRAAARARRPPSGRHHQRRRRHLPAPVYSEWAARFKDSTGTTVNYQADRLGRRHRPVHRRHRRLRRHRLGDEARGGGGRQEEGRRRSTSRPSSAPSPSPTTSTASTRASSSTARRSPTSSSARSRSGTTPRSPGSTAASSLPDTDITVCHRSDESGTTKIFTQFLADYCPEWKSGPGVDKTVKWPTGTGAKGNDGVAGCVKQTDGAVGYVEQAYALQNNFTTAAVKNKDGQFVEPIARVDVGGRRGRRGRRPTCASATIDAPGADDATRSPPSPSCWSTRTCARPGSSQRQGQARQELAGLRARRRPEGRAAAAVRAAADPIRPKAKAKVDALQCNGDGDRPPPSRWKPGRSARAAAARSSSGRRARARSTRCCAGC